MARRGVAGGRAVRVGTVRVDGRHPDPTVIAVGAHAPRRRAQKQGEDQGRERREAGYGHRGNPTTQEARRHAAPICAPGTG